MYWARLYSWPGEVEGCNGDSSSCCTSCEVAAHAPSARGVGLDALRTTAAAATVASWPRMHFRPEGGCDARSSSCSISCGLHLYALSPRTARAVGKTVSAADHSSSSSSIGSSSSSLTICKMGAHALVARGGGARFAAAAAAAIA
jgi:hypothetical protein